MSLETRVETLEHELKILKNEIESTLLEIQNQILVHYYPALRAEELAPPKDFSPFGETMRAEKGDEPQGKESVRSQSGSDEMGSAPATKEISLTEIRRKSNKSGSAPEGEVTAAPKELIAPPVETIHQATLAHLARWVNESVEKVGKAQTLTLIDSAAEAHSCTPATVNALRQLVDLSEEEAPPVQVETKDLLNALLKLNKAFDQAAKSLAPSMQKVQEEDHGQGNHNDLLDHR